MKKNGFTLVEILVTLTILVVLALIMVGILNPIVLVNKGYDSQRKKDLNRIKVAFEEYFNDKGYYPPDLSWNTAENCNSETVFAPYLNSWPCDPSGTPYIIIVDQRMHSFRVIANLQNKKDKDIPTAWYTRTDILISGVDLKQVNYGVSSSNILWYDRYIDPECDITECAQQNIDGTGGCNSVHFTIGCNSAKDGKNCYYRYTTGECLEKCRTPCCGYGCNR